MPRRAASDLSTPQGRLRHMRDEAGRTNQYLADRTGIKIDTIRSHMKTGGNNFDAAQAKSYARALNKPDHWSWLLHDIEPAPADKRPLSKTKTSVEQLGIADGAAGLPMVTIREIDVNAGAGGGGDMPAAYDQLPDGSWIPTDAVAAQVMFPAAWIISLGLDPTRTDLVRVRGDSMSPEIEDGDWVFVDRRVHQLVADDLYLFFDGFGVVVKSLAVVRAPRGEEPKVQILSANAKYPPQTVPLSDVWIIGRVHYRIGRIVRGR